MGMFVMELLYCSKEFEDVLIYVKEIFMELFNISDIYEILFL